MPATARVNKDGRDDDDFDDPRQILTFNTPRNGP